MSYGATRTRKPRGLVLPGAAIVADTGALHACANAVAAGECDVEPPQPDDLRRIAAAMDDYADFPLGFVDAAIVAIAERLGTRGIRTTGRRHVGAVRPRPAHTVALAPVSPVRATS